MAQLLNYEFDTDRVVEHLNTRGMFVLRNLLSKELVEALKLEGSLPMYQSLHLSERYRCGTRSNSLYTLQSPIGPVSLEK